MPEIEERHVVSAILWTDDGRVLLQLRDDRPDLRYPNQWTLFGGQVEAGETPDEAIRRELIEELELDDQPLTLDESYICPVRTVDGVVTTTNHVYSGRLARPFTQLNLHEGQAMTLIVAAEASRLELAFGQNPAFERFRARFEAAERKKRPMKKLKYLLYEPEGLAAGERAPLIFFLHGSGERGNDLQRVKWWSPFQYLDAGHALPAFVAAPQCPDELIWADVLDSLDHLLDDLLRKHPIDPDRVLLTGFSMGGFGVWQWALHRPERFAALMPVGGNGFRFRSYQMPADLCTLKHIPIWIFHSAGDTIVPVSGADEFHQALLACGAAFGYTRYPDEGHTETAVAAYGERRHYDWLLKQKRQGKP